MLKVDARGRSCPEPVIMTKKAIEESQDKNIEILVDAMVAVENIKRFVTNLGYKVNVEEFGEDFSIKIKK